MLLAEILILVLIVPPLVLVAVQIQRDCKLRFDPAPLHGPPDRQLM